MKSGSIKWRKQRHGIAIKRGIGERRNSGGDIGGVVPLSIGGETLAINGEAYHRRHHGGSNLYGGGGNDMAKK